MKKYALPIAVGIALFVGLMIGFFVGRMTLESKWSNPVGVVSPADFQKSSSAKDANPTPPVGAKLVKPLPLLRMRQVVGKLTEKDPLKVTLTSFGNGNDGSELHLMMKNEAPCKVVDYSGVVYAYDAWGKPVKANAAGEAYLAFRSDATDDKRIGIDPKGKYMHAQGLKHIETASIGVAHVDAYTCADGTKWARN